MAQKVFIAGHTGLIGSAVARRLSSGQGYAIVTAPHAELELTDRTQVARFLSLHRPDHVILAAGAVGGILRNKTYPADMITANLAIQLNVITGAHDAGVRKLIMFGSSCMYPRVCEQPMAEAQLFSGVPEPTSMAYAVAKMAGVQLCLSYNQQYGELRFLPIIPNSVYGPNDNFDPENGHVMSALIRRFHDAKLDGASEVVLWGTGTPRREFLYADDVADVCTFLLEKDTGGLQLPLNVGCGADISIRELSELIAKTVGFEGRVRWDASKPDGAPRKLLDSGRINALGWHPKTSLEDGVKATYAWYCQKQEPPRRQS